MKRFDKPDGYLVVSWSKNGARIQFKISAQKYLYTQLRRSDPLTQQAKALISTRLQISLPGPTVFPASAA
jgi:hypothetical protein